MTRSNIKPRLLFMSSNTSGTGQKFVQTARDLGLEPLLIDNDPMRFPFVANLNVEFITADPADNAVVDRIIENVSRDQLIAGAVSSSEYYQAAAARISQRFNRPVAAPAALTRCRNKAQQRQVFAAAGIAQPRFVIAENLAKARNAAFQIGFPVVVKPVDGTGSVGVKLALDAATLRTVAGENFARTVNERGLAVDRRILVEEYARGPEYSVELWNGQAIGVTEKLLGLPPVFVEIGHTFPAPLCAHDTASAIRAAEAATRVLEVGHGASHIELRLTAAGPLIIEVNSRLAGGFIPELLKLTGIDMIGRVIATAAGLVPPAPSIMCQSAAIRFVLPPQDGVLAGLHGVAAAELAPGVTDVALYAAIGSKVGLFGDFRDRIGHVIATGDSPLQAAARADAALNSLRVCLNP